MKNLFLLLILLILFIDCKSDQIKITNIAKNDKSSDHPVAAERKKELKIEMEIPKYDPDENFREQYVRKLDSEKQQEIIEGYARYDQSVNVRKAAVYKLENQDTIANIVEDAAEDENIRNAAILMLHPISRQDLLNKIVLNDESVKCRRTAVRKVNYQKVLAIISKNDGDDFIRRCAVKKLNDPGLLLDLAKNDPSHMVRREAVSNKYFTDQRVLADIAENDQQDYVRRIAVEKLDSLKWQDLFIKIALNKKAKSQLRQAAVKKIEDQDVLVKLAKKDKAYWVRTEAVRKISDQEILKKLMKYEKNEMVRRVLIQKIDDQDLIESTALNDENEDVRMSAVGKLRNKEIIEKIALEDIASRVRVTAVWKISDKDALVYIVRNDKNREVRRMAVRGIKDQSALLEIVKKAKEVDVQYQAVKQITDLNILKSIVKSDKRNLMKETAEKRIFLLIEKANPKNKSRRFIEEVAEKIYPGEKRILNHNMFKILGILSEYISRFNTFGNRWEDLVEGFNSKETEIADIFEKLIIQLQKDTNRDFNYSKKIGKQGNIFFYSKSLSKMINSHYMMKGGIATLDAGIFKKADKKEKMAYIGGAYLRFGKMNRNLIEGANCHKKLVTICKILSDLNCREIALFTPMTGIGVMTILLFQPSSEVQNYLRITNIKSVRYIKTLWGSDNIEKIFEIKD